MAELTDTSFSFSFNEVTLTAELTFLSQPLQLNQITFGFIGNPDVFQAEVIDGTTPLPPALPLFATGLGALGVLGWRRKQKAAAFI